MDKLEAVEALYVAFRNRDYFSLNQILARDIEWNQNTGFPDGGSYVGLEAIIANVFDSFADSWSEWRFEIDRYLEAPDSVIVTGSYIGTHLKTGKDMISAAAHIYDFEDGKIIRFTQYADTMPIHQAMS